MNSFVPLWRFKLAILYIYGSLQSHALQTNIEEAAFKYALNTLLCPSHVTVTAIIVRIVAGPSCSSGCRAVQGVQSVAKRLLHTSRGLVRDLLQKLRTHPTAVCLRCCDQSNELRPKLSNQNTTADRILAHVLHCQNIIMQLYTNWLLLFSCFR